MGAYTDIHAALETKLAGISGLPTGISRENRSFAPQVKVPWMQAVFNPAPTGAAGIGVGGKNLYRGTYDVSLNYPSGGGITAANTAADALVTNFGRGVTLTAGSLTVRVSMASRITGYTESDWYRVPVTIEWFAYS